jgi:ENTS family enterobactin (siderophore) exporter
MTGRQITLVAVPYQVYLLTGSTLAVGLLGLVQAVPLILAGLYAGALADRFDRRLVMLASLTVLGLTSLALAVGAATGGAPLWFIYAVTAVAGRVSTAEHSARSATVPRLVGPRRLAAALSLTQVLFQFALVAGPSAAGLIIAAAGLQWAYGIDVACFTVALACVLLLRPLPAPPEGRAVVIGWRAPAEALAYARDNPVLLSIFAVDLNAMVFGMPRALFPALAAHLFRVGPQGLGLLYAAPGAGALVGSLLSGWVSRIRRQGVAVLWAVAGWGAAITLFGLAAAIFPQARALLPLALVLLAVAGAADMVSAVFRQTIFQLSTPDRLRGRVSALNSMVVTAGPRLGDVEAGGVAALTSPVFSVVSGGVLCLLGVAAIAALVPALRRQAAAR